MDVLTFLELAFKIHARINCVRWVGFYLSNIYLRICVCIYIRVVFYSMENFIDTEVRNISSENEFSYEPVSMKEQSTKTELLKVQ